MTRPPARLAAAVLAAGLAPVACSDAGPGQVTEPEAVPLPEVELPVTLDDGFEDGWVALLIVPPGFTRDQEVVDGWGRLATTPRCEIRARTGVEHGGDGTDERAVTAELLTALAALDGAGTEITDAKVLFDGAMPPGPALAAGWDDDAGPVRTVARVAWSVLAESHVAVVAQLRCTGDVDEADLDAAWEHTLGALRVPGSPVAETWGP